jgi:plastocyanin domain-containing protein
MSLERRFAALLLIAPMLAPTVGLTATRAVAAEASPATQQVEVVVDRGYQPARVEVKAGTVVRITFTKRDYTPCTKEVVFPSLGIRRELSVDKPVVIELPALPAGEVEFHCGMDMVRGKLVVAEAGS